MILIFTATSYGIPDRTSPGLAPPAPSGSYGAPQQQQQGSGFGKFL